MRSRPQFTRAIKAREVDDEDIAFTADFAGRRIACVLHQHSFWYHASQKMFEDALKADPACSIAFWRIALSLLWNPHIAPPVKNPADGAAAIAKASVVGLKTELGRSGLVTIEGLS